MIETQGSGQQQMVLGGRQVVCVQMLQLVITAHKRLIDWLIDLFPRASHGPHQILWAQTTAQFEVSDGQSGRVGACRCRRGKAGGFCTATLFLLLPCPSNCNIRAEKIQESSSSSKLFELSPTRGTLWHPDDSPLCGCGTAQRCCDQWAGGADEWPAPGGAVHGEVRSVRNTAHLGNWFVALHVKHTHWPLHEGHSAASGGPRFTRTFLFILWPSWKIPGAHQVLTHSEQHSCFSTFPRTVALCMNSCTLWSGLWVYECLFAGWKWI